MDVIYDVVESIHIFIPLVAIVFICVVLYINGRKDTEESHALRTESSIVGANEENVTTSKTEEDKKCD
ncbi:unnamed protein product [Auanema sp. JU1783]|nr:unnamed protein product [Auanema sp. JU1783]